ncbi:MAG: KH domain-containing protein [Desulfurococcaceae archaeon]|nr:KH domain-containing protein [Desulfurococcaceae archaeon]MCC6052846.1 KH domain-containing protein [Desulfurococcaceae archaeon]
MSEKEGRFILGVTRVYEKVPLDRIGVLLGSNGRVKREIEEKTKTKLTVDSTSGSVVIEPAFQSTTALDLLKAQNIVRAIAHGFSPERAFRLLEDDQVLEVIDVRQYIGDKPNHIKRVLGRIIGENGKTRRILEEMTGAYISIYETFVAIIASYEVSNVVKKAVEMLTEGRPHSTVYKYIDREMFTLKRKGVTEMWKRYF